MKRSVFWAALPLCFFAAARGPAAEPQSGELKIGAVMPLSGPLASYGKKTLDGVRLKIDAINAAGGIEGRKIKLLTEDNRGDAVESRNAFRKLAGDKVSAILGPVTSTNTIAVRRDAAALKIPTLSPTATNDKATAGNPWMFRACFNDSFQGKALAGYAFNSKGVKKAAILTDMNSDYSKGLSASFKDAFTRLGGKITAEEGYRQKDSEFGAQLKKVKDSGAELLFVPGYPPEVPLIIKQAKVVGLDARLCGADGWDNDSVISESGDNITGCFITGAFSRESPRPVVKEFAEAFEREYKRPPGTFEALGYDAAAMLAEAMRKGVSPENIRDGLGSISKLEAVTGVISSASDGNVSKAAVILEIVRDASGKYGTKYLDSAGP